jgi:Mg-chelatase subunit ChlD
VFLAYMNKQRTDDRIGLVSYTSSVGAGTLEVPLTDDYGLIESTSRQRQAGHYHPNTNIAGGIEVALTELRTRGRAGALKLIIVLSDGKTNYPGGERSARYAALQQAQQAANDNIPILTISLGTDADLNLMQDIADITNGIHFVVPGGNDVADYEDQLFELFAQLAGHRALRLVD